jgi:hypothetical protein
MKRRDKTMKAKKFIEKTVEGEYELIKNHVVEIDISAQIVENIALDFLGAGEDPEWDYTKYGVLTNEDGEVAYIKIGKFLDAIDKQNEDKNAVDEDELESESYTEIQKLKPYRDYELYC